jgi:hypothetical protein
VVEPGPSPDVVAVGEICVRRDIVELLAVSRVGGGALVAVGAAVWVVGCAVALEVAGSASRAAADDAVDHLPFVGVAARGLAPGERKQRDLARTATVDGGSGEVEGYSASGLDLGRVAACVVSGGPHLAGEWNATSINAERGGLDCGRVVRGR